MRKVRIAFAAAAVLLGITTAFATTTKDATKHYVRSSTGYDLVDNTGDCVPAQNSFCTYVTNNASAPAHINIGQETTWGLTGDTPNAVYVP